MNKTKFGLANPLYIALIYFAAMLNPILALLLIGYALLAEESDALRKSARQALVLLLAVWAVRGAYTVLNDLIVLLNSFIPIGYLHMPYGLSALINVAADGVLAAAGVLSLFGRSGVLADPVEKVFNRAEETKAVPAAAPVQAPPEIPAPQEPPVPQKDPAPQGEDKK